MPGWANSPRRRIEREVEVEADRDRTVGRGLAGHRDRHRVEAANVGEPPSGELVGCVIGNRPFEIRSFRGGPISGEFGALHPLVGSEIPYG